MAIGHDKGCIDGVTISKRSFSRTMAHRRATAPGFFTILR